MVARLIDAVPIDTRIVVPMLMIVGFISWVILNEGRTHRLERLIRAFRDRGKGDDEDV